MGGGSREWTREELQEIHERMFRDGARPDWTCDPVNGEINWAALRYTLTIDGPAIVESA